jgi:glutathione peroxidase
MSQKLYAIPLKSIEGKPLTLEHFKGKVLLIVNVASKCGLTPQYEGLEALYKEKRAQGFEVLGFPANDFRDQEPGSDEDIQAFCTLNYSVQFPLFAKIAVSGAEQHPLYSILTQAQPLASGDGPMRERLKGYGIEVELRPGHRCRRLEFAPGHRRPIKPDALILSVLLPRSSGSALALPRCAISRVFQDVQAMIRNWRNA